MQVVRIGHSPDPDDAFMFYALTAGKVKIDGVQNPLAGRDLAQGSPGCRR